MKDKAPQAQPLPRPPERSRRNRRPHVSASRTPTANAVARQESHEVSLLPSAALSCQRSAATSGNEGTLDDDPAVEGAADRAQRWQSGYDRSAATPTR